MLYTIMVGKKQDFENLARKEVFAKTSPKANLGNPARKAGFRKSRTQSRI